MWLQLVAAWLLVLSMRVPQLLGIDTWLALVAGREIAQHGLPQTDTLTLWTLGEPWIDQQWLGHLLIYGVTSLGGLRLALLFNVVALVATLVIILALARRLGASPRSTAVGGALYLLASASSTSLRTDTLAHPLFAILLWLVLLDRDVSSRRMLLAIPLLAVWANLHGSVVLAAGIVVLHGLVKLYPSIRGRRRPPLVSLLPTVAAPLLVLASPYGPSLVGYFGRTLGNDAFPTLLAEWTAPTLLGDWRFFLLAGISSWLVVRHGGRLTPSARVLFAVLLVAALVAVRNGVWFALLCGSVLPLLFDEAVRPGETRSLGRPQVVVWAVLAVLIAIALPAAFSRPAASYESSYPAAAVQRVSTALEADPTLHVLAGERFADWLLWKIPEAHGRVAFDARFELLPSARLDDVTDFLWALEGWPRLLDAHRLVVLEPARHERNAETLRQMGARLLYEDDLVSVHLVSSGRRR